MSGRLAVGHAVGLEFDERGAQPVGLDGSGRIDHRRRRALGLLHVRHHRVAAREVVALRAPDPPPGRLSGPRPPFERDRHRGIEAVEILEQVRVRLAGGRQERVEDHRLAVEPQVRPLRFQLRQREPPVHAAPRRAVPRHARAVDEFGEKPGTPPRPPASRRACARPRASGPPRPSPGTGPPPPRSRRPGTSARPASGASAAGRAGPAVRTACSWPTGRRPDPCDQTT